MKQKHVYTDEASYVNRKLRIISAAELMSPEYKRTPGVIPHNTMRFDVQLAHIWPMLDEGPVTKDQIVSAIRKAIIQAVEETVGAGLDGFAIPGGATVSHKNESVMMHRESIHFDLS